MKRPQNDLGLQVESRMEGRACFSSFSLSSLYVQTRQLRIQAEAKLK